jgi:hypothetical protein
MATTFHMYLTVHKCTAYVTSCMHI